jgi:DNA polymerase III epsilon subunit-like protein
VSPDEILDQHRGLPLRVLFFDIETAPLLSYHWRVWKENIAPSQIERHSFMLSWAGRWVHQQAPTSAALTPAEAKSQDDGRIVASLADQIRKADVVVAHNLDGFDLPVLNTRLLDLRLPPLPTVTTIDTLKVAKRNFRQVFNRLSYLAEFLGIESKHEMSFEDWRQACAGNQKALSKMRAYGRQDVVVLEQVYREMAPYSKGLPRMVDASHEMQRVCPHCGAPFEALKPAGFYRTKASNFPKFRCDECGKEARSRSASRGKKLALHPL